METSAIVEEDRQRIVDEEHLKLLSIAYVVDGAMYAAFAPFGLFYALMGAFMGTAIAQAPATKTSPPPPAFIGWIFGAFGLGIFGLFAVAATLKLLCAHRLRKRRSRTFCLVVAAFSCFAVPYGTAIGVWTFLVLLRPTVGQSFAESTEAAPHTSSMRGGA